MELPQSNQTQTPRERDLRLRAPDASETTIGKLPFEILSIIFQHVCLIPSFTEAFDAHYIEVGKPSAPLLPLILGAVAFRWRQVVWSSPQLWTWLVLDIKEGSTGNYTQIVDHYLVNSGHRPLHLEMRYVSAWEGSIHVTQEIILPRIAPRLESLILVNFTDSSAAGVSTVELSLLRNLAIVNDEDHELESFDIHNVSDLDCFALRASPDWDDVELEIPWSDITRAELREAPIHIALQILYECEDLHTFHARTAKHWDYLGEDFWLDEPLTLDELTSFEWPSYGGPSVDNLIRHLRLPVLEDLVVYYGVFDDNPWAEFFGHLPPETLERVAFHEFKPDFYSDDAYPVYYLMKWGVESLTLYDCHLQFVNDFLESLAIQDEEDETPLFLPLLSSLIICQKHDLTFGLVSSHIEDKMKRMLRGRFGDDPPFFLFAAFAMVSKREKYFCEGTIVSIALP